MTGQMHIDIPLSSSRMAHSRNCDRQGRACRLDIIAMDEPSMAAGELCIPTAAQRVNRSRQGTSVWKSARGRLDRTARGAYANGASPSELDAAPAPPLPVAGGNGPHTCAYNNNTEIGQGMCKCQKIIVATEGKAQQRVSPFGIVHFLQEHTTSQLSG